MSELIEKRIPLSRTYSVDGENISEAVLREPSMPLYLRLGRPVEWLKSPDGNKVLHTHKSVLKSYLDECLVSPPGGSAQPFAAVDALAIEDALLDFFSIKRPGMSV